MLTQCNKFSCHFLWARKRKKKHHYFWQCKKNLHIFNRELNRFPLQHVQVGFVSSITFCVLLQAARSEGENTQEWHSTHCWYLWQIAASRVLQHKHGSRTKCLWVCLLVPQKSLVHPEFRLTLLPTFPGILWKKAGTWHHLSTTTSAPHRHF